MAEDDHISLEEVHEQCSKICSVTIVVIKLVYF